MNREGREGRREEDGREEGRREGGRKGGREEGREGGTEGRREEEGREGCSEGRVRRKIRLQCPTVDAPHPRPQGTHITHCCIKTPDPTNNMWCYFLNKLKWVVKPPQYGVL